MLAQKPWSLGVCMESGWQEEVRGAGETGVRTRELPGTERFGFYPESWAPGKRVKEGSAAS